MDKTPAGKHDVPALRDKVKEISRDLEDGIDTISNFKRSLKAAFYAAIEDDCIRKNPFNFALDTVIEDDRGRKAALTPKAGRKPVSFHGAGWGV